MTLDTSISFEFSAPRNEEALEKVLQVHDRLLEASPAFFSVTYGAGGSTKDGTRQAVLQLAETGSNIAPHLSFGSDTPERIEALLKEYQAAGISRVVALRGDMPSGMFSQQDMVYASELVAFIREKTGDHFHIEVAAYPEIHPDSPSVQEDIHYFKQKVDAGADSAITQYFYNPDAYFRFVDNCAAQGVSIPIVPGIMPITNVDTLIRFSEKCGAEIPRWMRKHLETHKDDPDGLKAFCVDTVADLCEKLLEGGAPGLHFYTLNQSLPSLRIIRNLAAR